MLRISSHHCLKIVGLSQETRPHSNCYCLEFHFYFYFHRHRHWFQSRQPPRKYGEMRRRDSIHIQYIRRVLVRCSGDCGCNHCRGRLLSFSRNTRRHNGHLMRYYELLFSCLQCAGVPSSRVQCPGGVDGVLVPECGPFQGLAPAPSCTAWLRSAQQQRQRNEDDVT